MALAEYRLGDPGHETDLGLTYLDDNHLRIRCVNCGISISRQGRDEYRCQTCRDLDRIPAAPPELRTLGACKDLDTYDRNRLYFPDLQPGQKIPLETRELCGSCPVRQSCYDYAVDAKNLVGLWAATTERERTRERQRRQRQQREEGAA